MTSVMPRRCAALLSLVLSLAGIAATPAPAQVFDEFADPDTAQSPVLYTLIRGPDGNIYFVVEDGYVGEITPAGVMTRPPFQTTFGGDHMHGAASGPDGKLYFANKAWLVQTTLAGAFVINWSSGRRRSNRQRR